MNDSAKNINEENYRPSYVTKAFKVIVGQTAKSPDSAEDQSSSPTNGLEPEIDLMTVVQMPVRRLKETVAFYVEALGMELTFPERPIERNIFVQTKPKIGPSLHLIETPDSEFRHLHGTANGERNEYAALYVKSLHELEERLLRAGTGIVAKPLQGYMSFLDPEGHLIGAYERTNSDINERFESNVTGFRHVRMVVSDTIDAARFFELAFGMVRAKTDDDAIYIAVREGEANQPMIRLVQAAAQTNLQPMHWMLDGRPKHALELHSKNIGVLRQRVLECGGAVQEELEFTGCGGYLKLHTPDGHYIWVNQDRRYCGY